MIVTIIHMLSFTKARLTEISVNGLIGQRVYLYDKHKNHEQFMLFSSLKIKKNIPVNIYS